ncbi:MAG: phosphoglycerate mutase family protein [Rhodothermales bacterium]
MSARIFFAALVLGGAFLAACQSTDAPDPVVIYLMRHAEKQVPPADTTADPSLDAAGMARAAALARTLGEAGVTRILSTNFKRTIETVEPLAQQLGLEVERYDPRALDAVAELLKTSTGRIVVVGHSNTTPQLVGLLGGESGPAYDEVTEYDRLYIVTIASGKTTTIQLRYGD